MDRSTFFNRFFTRWLLTPSVIVPTTLGASGLLVGLGTDLGGMWTILAGALGLIAGAGIAGSRLILGADAIALQVRQEYLLEEAEKIEASLNDLDRRLRVDNDPRPEAEFASLRQLYTRFREDTRWQRRLNKATAQEIVQQVENLFQGCIISLERTITLADGLPHVAAPDARSKMHDLREGLIQEIQASVAQLKKTLDDVHTMPVASESGDQELSRIRQELNESLEVAKRVEARMKTLEAGWHKAGTAQEREI